MELTRTDGYQQLLEQISDAYTQGRVRAVQAVNTQLIETYWQVGQHIVEYEQAGRRALLKGRLNALDDKIHRAMGTLQTARLMSSNEAMQ